MSRNTINSSRKAAYYSRDGKPTLKKALPPSKGRSLLASRQQSRK